MGNLKITQKKSPIGSPPDQKGTLRALGLRRIGTSVVKKDTPEIRGMIFHIRHLLEVTEESS